MDFQLKTHFPVNFLSLKGKIQLENVQKGSISLILISLLGKMFVAHTSKQQIRLMNAINNYKNWIGQQQLQLL